MGNELSFRNHGRERSFKNGFLSAFTSNNSRALSSTSSDIPTNTESICTSHSTKSTMTKSTVAKLTSQNPASMDQALVRWEDGRRYQAIENNLYMWPNDEIEGDRLMRQHFLLRYTFGGLYKAPVEKRLQKAGIKVLDVGTGPGTWCLDMAHDYGVSEFVGIDISPTFPQQIRPHNVTFQFGNVIDRLPFEDNTFDYAFQRFLAFGFRKDDWPKAIQELKRVVKPGGWIELTEMDMVPHKMNDTHTPTLDSVVSTIESLGQDPVVARKLGFVLAEGGFEKITHNYVSLPVGWPEGNRLGGLMKDDMEESFRALQPFLIRSLGFSNRDAFENEVIQRSIAEARESQTFLNYHYAFGRVPKDKE